MAWIASNTLRTHVPTELLAPKQAVHNDVELSFYSKPPTNDVSIHDFEVYALDRLRGTASSSCTLLSQRLALSCNACCALATRGPSRQHRQRRMSSMQCVCVPRRRRHRGCMCWHSTGPLATQRSLRHRLLAALKGMEQAKSQGKKDKELETVIQQLCAKHLKVCIRDAQALEELRPQTPRTESLAVFCTRMRTAG